MDEKAKEQVLQKAYHLAYQYEQTYRGCPQCVLAALQELHDPADHVRLDQQRRVTLVGDFQRFQARMMRRHRFERGGRQDVGIGAADRHHRRLGEGVELLP